jgi:hypothetical protein
VQCAARVDCRERSHGKEQRIPGQEGRHDEPGLGEDHRKEDRVYPEVVPRDQLDQMAIEMQHDIDEPRQHGAGGYR